MFKASPASGLIAAALLSGLAGLPLSAAAQIYKCPQAGGTFSYQGTPCPSTGKAPARPTAAELNAQKPASTDDKPFYDPYAGAASSRPHPVAPPPMQAQQSPADAAPARPTIQQQQARYDRERIQEENEKIRKQNEITLAHNQEIRCSQARANVNVLSEQVRAYRLNAKGERVYISDESRAGEIASAQRTAAAECR